MHFDHIATQVPHIDEALSWYQKHFPETKILYQDETWAFMEVCGLKMAFVTADQHPSHIAWRVDDEVTLQKLSKKFGKSIKKHRDNTQSFYLQGPGDQSLEIIYTP